MYLIVHPLQNPVDSVHTVTGFPAFPLLSAYWRLSSLRGVLYVMTLSLRTRKYEQNMTAEIVPIEVRCRKNIGLGLDRFSCR